MEAHFRTPEVFGRRWWAYYGSAPLKVPGPVQWRKLATQS